jgi:hypothetical protein
MDPFVDDPTQHSTAEGLGAAQSFSIAGTPRATFDHDRIDVQVDPSTSPRFLVVNELYHPGWRAWVDGTPAQIYPTNVVMRGVIVPPGTSTVEFRFVPFLVTGGAAAIFALGLALAGLQWWVLRRGLLDRWATRRWATWQSGTDPRRGQRLAAQSGGRQA